MKMIHPINKKLNLGAGSDWRRQGWEVLDHAAQRSCWRLKEQAWELPYYDNSFQAVFCSHMFEHISHFKIEQVICEINRVLKTGGLLRVLTPDLKKLASAYVNGDTKTMDRYIAEDGSGIKRTLGLGQAFINFILSSGIDNYMITSDFSAILGGYAHVFCYDYEMLSVILKQYGFTDIRQCAIGESQIAEHKELRSVPYDKDAGHSLVIECVKKQFVPFSQEKALLITGPYKQKVLSGPKWLKVSLMVIGHLYSFYSYIYSTLTNGKIKSSDQ